MSKKIVIALNGQKKGSNKEYKEIINSADFLIAADGGANFYEKLGFLPDLIIGDLDSLTREKLKHYRNKGIEIISYPVKKDETDGELALKYCERKAFKNIIITNTLGGRFDQQLANIFLLEYALRHNLNAIIKEANLEIGIIEQEKSFYNKKGSTLSLIPLSKKVSDLNITGCKYNLNQGNLYRYKSRGISNMIKAETALIKFGKGILLYIIN